MSDSSLDGLLSDNQLEQLSDRPVEGVVVRAPSSDTDLVDVAIPSFDGDQGFQQLRWMPRGTDRPTNGDHVLVIFTSEGAAWAAAWWPS